MYKLRDLKSEYKKADDKLFNIEYAFTMLFIVTPTISVIIFNPIRYAIGEAIGYAYVGAFCRNNLGEINRCSVNSNSVKAKTWHNKNNMCGGFVGKNSKTGIIKGCNTTGDEIHNKIYTGGCLGGFVGKNIGNIENSNTNISVL